MSQQVEMGFWRRALPLVAVALVLRPLVTAVGPVLPEIRAEYGMNATQAALLSTLPVVCFGLGALLVPRILHRITPNKALSLVLIILALGGQLRLLGHEGWLFLGTFFIGVGIAIGNVTPSVITRRDFSDRIGWMMGLVTGSISATASIAAMISYPVSQHFGSWRYSLEVFAILPIVVWFIWRTYRHPGTVDATLDTPHDMRGLLKSKLAWGLVIYFGLQSTNFYCMTVWLPTILRDAGVDPTIAGAQTAFMVLVGFPIGVGVPMIAAKTKSQVSQAVAYVIAFAIGLGGLWALPTQGTWLWVFLLGVGMGASFPLALTLVVLRADSPATARDLGSFMQGGGYMISAIGPVVLGALHDAFNNWTSAYVALFIALAGQLIAGVIVSRPVVISEA